MNVVDSSAWLAYFADEPNAEFFAPAIENPEELLVPTVCLFEVFKVLLREAGDDKAFQGIAAMLQGRIISLDTEYCLESATVALSEKLALADSVIYTTALKHNATLWTQDAHFEGKPQVQYRPKQG